ncbi:MAG TPA: polyphosphate kinase 1 [Gaiellaceae bacterium]|nr:polyphosphate kinase 1 [Gaiellaceae bacterium]
MTVSSRKRGKPLAERPERLLNRELSFLDYAARVLALAEDETVPLLERVKFCSIFSSMLDEFFMVRVAGLIGQAAAGRAIRSPDGRTPREALAEVREQVVTLNEHQSHLWRRELAPALAAEGIAVSRIEELDDDEQEQLGRLWERDVFPVLTPLAVGPGQPFPYISALSVSLGLFVRDRETGEERFARVKVPEGLQRFQPVGNNGRLVLLEGIIAHYLGELFSEMEILERSLFRVTRDADLDVSDEADDLLEAVELELRRARFGEVTRLEVSASMSQAMRQQLQSGLNVANELVYPITGTLDLVDATELAAIDRPDLKDEPWVPVPRPNFVAPDPDHMFAAIRARDQFTHWPYDSFAASYEAFLEQSVRDPNVIAIKATLYRTSEDTPLVPALVDAADNGKQSVALVEIQARGDERRNIEWSRALEQAGAHVVHGFPGLKIHAKATLVVRRDADTLRRYVHLGTGNYNAVTAGTYEDFGLFTADEEIAADVADLFNYLTGFARPASFRKLLVAPFTLRQRVTEEIRAVAAAAEAGKKARMKIKVNGLTDVELIDELYEASRAGARIEIVCRGVCSLRPGVRGLSEGITVRSVLGRFLEHSRLFWFDAADRTTVLMGSADLMPRNLDHRVEELVPVEDPTLRTELSSTFSALLADTAAAWELQPDGAWERVRVKKDDRPRSAQATLMRRARRRAVTSRPRTG